MYISIKANARVHLHTFEQWSVQILFSDEVSVWYFIGDICLQFFHVDADGRNNGFGGDYFKPHLPGKETRDIGLKLTTESWIEPEFSLA